MGPMMFFAKSSLLLLYLSIFGLKKSFRYATYTAIVVTFCNYWTFIPLTAYYFAPSPGKAWSITSIGTKCPTAAPYGIATGVVGILLDLFIVILPIPVVLRLQMSRRKRIAVLAVFLTRIL